MQLLLDITSSKHPPSSYKDHFVVGSQGGIIGRAPENDFVLPDPDLYVSSQHAIIRFQDDEYFLTDTSVNGVFINDGQEPVGRNNSIKLRNGDRLFIGDYELSVSIRSGDAPGQFSPVDTGLDTPQSGSATPFRIPPVADESPAQILDGSHRQADVHGSIDWDKSDSHLASARNLDQASESNHVSPEHEHFTPPAFHTEEKASDWDNTDIDPGQISEVQGQPDWDRTYIGAPLDNNEPARPQEEQVEDLISTPAAATGDQPEWDRTGITMPPEPPGHTEEHPDGNAGSPESASVLEKKNAAHDTEKPDQPGQKATPGSMQKPQMQPRTASGGDTGLLEIFFEAAGLETHGIPAEAAPEFMKLFGTLYRNIVHGLMDVLRARAELKNEFRMRQTQISPVENNPLKFSGRVEEAMEHLVFKQGTGFLPPEEAFNEAFQDIKDHQIALVVGMRAAFDSLLHHLDPRQLENRVEKGKKIGHLLPLNRKASCWDRYVEWYEELSVAAEDDFQNLFGDEFTRAYEEQIGRLSLLRKKSGK
jgi:type VI secretion system protein